MSAPNTGFEVPSGLPDIVSLGIRLWGDPTRWTPDKVEFGAKSSKVVIPAPDNRWYDHEAKTGGGYFDLYKMVFRKLPDPPGFPIPPGMAKELGNPVAWWDYHDAAGNTVARVVRFHPPGQDKTYRQCRPDGERWRWKTKGIQIPVYHLPDVLKAPDGTICCIPEGEKKVDQIQAWGLLATCNAGGAKKFLAHHARTLARFDCVIMGDNDEAGRSHIEVVAAALQEAGCRSIRLLTLPGLGPKGDVVNWAQAGGTASVFAELVAQAPVYEVRSQPDTPPLTEADADGPPPDIDDPGYHEAVDALADEADAIGAAVAELNQQYMVVIDGGKTKVYREVHDPILNRRYFSRMSFEDFRKLYLNRTIRVPKGDGETTSKKVAEIWLHHPDRRQFIGGMVFDPSGKHIKLDQLNLWRGFGVTEIPGTWGLMQLHIKEVICSGRESDYTYVLDWMARLIQFPAQQGEVAIVLKGFEGCGKSIVARALCYILGQHSMHITHAKHLTGNFNIHLRDTAFLFADEAFYAGDVVNVGVLKALITEPVLCIEGKGVDMVLAANCLHIMMASNNDWVVPASLQARRFLVLQCSNERIGDIPYFGAIQAELENGGYEAMLYDLRHRDIASFNVRSAPDTEGLQEQKKLSLPIPEAWWLDVLLRGYVWKSKLGLEHRFSEWDEVVSTDILYASYGEFAERHRERHILTRESFGKFMVKMGVFPAKKRHGVVGEHMIDVPVDQSGNSTRRQAEVVTKAVAPSYRVGSLGNAQMAYEKVTNFTVNWDPAAKMEPED